MRKEKNMCNCSITKERDAREIATLALKFKPEKAKEALMRDLDPSCTEHNGPLYLQGLLDAFKMVHTAIYKVYGNHQITGTLGTFTVAAALLYLESIQRSKETTTT